MPQILAFLGVGLMITTGVGSAIGCVIGGSAALGGLKKRSEKFGNYLVLCALPGTQGLYGFMGFFITQPKLTATLTLNQGAAILGLGIAMSAVGIISAIYQGIVCANAISAISTGQDDAFGKGMILAAFPELYAIISLLATFLTIQAI
jgi:V/A-type H+/Na+-transporting ATPase subunit K